MVPWGTPPAAHLYKGLATLVLGLIALQYMFGSVIETRHWGELFTSSTRNLQQTKFTQPVSGLHNSLIVLSLVNSTGKHSNNTEIGAINSTMTIPSPHNKTSTYHLTKDEQNINNTYLSVVDNNSSYISSALNGIPQVLSICPPIPPDLNGPVKINKSPVPSISELEKRFSWLHPGGGYAPENCVARSIVAVIVPYRARAEHLLLFLAHMHPFLKKQQINYTIYIVEQEGNGPFNRAMLMNVGFTEALKHRPYECFIFHDVDLLPEDDRNIYSCPEQPRHMSVAVDEFKYRLPYSSIFGGVSAMTRAQFRTVNGFSNMFWGWGGEDDDMSNRIRFHHFHIARYPNNIARYTMLTHRKEKANPKRYETLSQGKKRYNTDGLNSLQYTMKQTRFNKLYTWLYVELHPPS